MKGNNQLYYTDHTNHHFYSLTHTNDLMLWFCSLFQFRFKNLSLSLAVSKEFFISIYLFTPPGPCTETRQYLKTCTIFQGLPSVAHSLNEPQSIALTKIAVAGFVLHFYWAEHSGRPWSYTQPTIPVTAADSDASPHQLMAQLILPFTRLNGKSNIGLATASVAARLQLQMQPTSTRVSPLHVVSDLISLSVLDACCVHCFTPLHAKAGSPRTEPCYCLI